MKWNKVLAAISLALVVAMPQTVFGFAYRLPTQSTKGLAKGNAVITDLNQPESVFYNPAATAFSEGFQTTFGSQYVTVRTDHELDRIGLSEKSKRKDSYIPNIYATWNLAPYNLEQLTIGFGANSPFGLAQVWQPESPIAPVIEKARLKVVNYAITTAYKINDKASIGSGIDITYSDAELQRVVDFGALAGMPRALDGFAEFKGTDTSVGFSTSLLLLPAENHSLAFTFRSEQVSKLEGDLKVRDIPAFTGLPSSLEGDGEARVKYPAVIEAGYGYQMGKLKLEFVLDWARWETVNELAVRSTSNPLIADLVYQADLENVFTYNASATYDANEWLDVYLGFIWTETPIPQNTFNAIIPDADRFALATGVSVMVKDVEIDAAFQWVHFEGRSIDNNVGAPLTTVDGNYDSDAFLVGVNATLRF